MKLVTKTDIVVHCADEEIVLPEEVAAPCETATAMGDVGEYVTPLAAADREHRTATIFVKLS